MEFSSQCDIINKHNQSTELYNYDIIIISCNDLAPMIYTSRHRQGACFCAVLH